MAEFGTTSFGSYVNHGINQNDESRLNNLYSNITFGTYSPSFSGVINVAAVSGFVARYSKIGDVVTVNGAFEMIATTGTVAGQTTNLTITLPITSNLANVYELAGSAVNGTVATGNKAQIVAETAADRALVKWLEVAANNAVQKIYSYNFSYQILT